MKIVVSFVLAFLFLGCSDNTKEETQKTEATQVVKVAVAEVKADAAKTEVKVEQEVANIAVKTDVADVTKAVEKVKVEAAKVTPTAKPSLDAGKTIFTVCAGCHGANAEKAALGKSQIIKGWAAAKVSDALHGYKAGTYGGVMKGVMAGQASKLSDGDIKAVAGYISTL